MQHSDQVEAVEQDFVGESLPTKEANVEIDAAAEKKLLRKIDLHLLPILWILYLFAFIDR